MKIGIYLEGSPSMGGGFFQSLKASLLFLDIPNNLLVFFNSLDNLTKALIAISYL